MLAVLKSESKSKDALERIRNTNKLYHLRRRPRCADGRLDLRHKVNRAFSKHAVVTDYYDPQDPTKAVDQDVIQQCLDRQQEEYDNARFEELSAKVKKLEEEQSSL